MKTTVTITSKRQLTIPSRVWKQMHLEGARYLEVEVLGNTLQLKKVDFANRMEDFWRKTASMVSGNITDESISQAARSGRSRKKL